MSTSHDREFEISLDDDEGERLMEKADALIQRHASLDTTPPDTDDLPVLTDIFDDRREPFIGESSPIILEPVEAEPALQARGTHDALAARLVALDTAISRHIEEWVASELPQLVSRELDELAEHLCSKAAAHLRATLLPLVSAEIADTLDREPEP